jgi:signal transduction histidine kinase
VSELRRQDVGWSDRTGRLGRLARVAPFPSLLVATTFAVLGPGGSARPAGPTLALAVVTAGWAALLWSPARLCRRPFKVAYFAGLLILVTVLTVWSPWYAFVSWVVFPQALVLFSSRGALLGLVAGCVLPTVVQSSVHASGLPEPSYALLLSFVLPLLAASWVAGRENDRRRALMRQLSETQQELVDQARRAGIADERARITQELHDTLTQALAATVARLEAAQHTQDSTDRQRQLEQASTAARYGLTESRRSLGALRPADLDGQTLGDALLALEADASIYRPPAGGPSVRVDIAGAADPVPPEIEHALYRVAREAVTNAVRHARAETVHVSLSWLDDLVLLDVTDDGIGFRPEPAGQARAACDGSGLGLATMRQRIRQVGGELTIESAPGEGTVISAGVPLAPATSQESP